MFTHAFENGAVLFSRILSACNFVARFEVLTVLLMEFLLKLPFFFLIECRVGWKGQRRTVFVACL
jgi:hypothetical protein